MPSPIKISLKDFLESTASGPPESILIVPERLASQKLFPRALKNLKIINEIVTVPQLARRFLESRLTVPKTSLSLSERLLLLAQIREQDSLAKLKSMLPFFRRLGPLGLAFSDWQSVLNRIEQNLSSEDLSSLTENILAFLQLKIEASKIGKVESEWEWVEAVLENVSESPTESPPYFLMATHELFPLEARFVDLLSVCRIVPGGASQDSTEALAELSETLKILPREEIVSGQTYLWCQESPLPGPAEAQAYFGEGALSFPPEDELKKGISFFERSLRAWENFSTNHALTQSFGNFDPRSAFCLKEAHFDSSLDFEGSLKFVETLNQDWAALLRELPRFKKLKAEEWISWLAFFFEEKNQSSSAPLPEDSAAILPLPSFPLPFSGSFSLVGSKASLLHLLREKVARLDPLPYSLKDAVEALGFAVPDLEREQNLLVQTLLSLKDRLSFVDFAKNKKASDFERSVTAPTLSPLSFVMSPSSFESYQKCPYRFYATRILKLQPAEKAERLDISALSKGTWMHEALETFFKNPWPEDVSSTLLQTLMASMDTCFGPQALSPDKKNLLRAYAEIMSGHLARTLKTVEKDLFLAFPERVLELEKSLKVTSLLGQAMRGTVDRIDHLSDKEMLLWDYKSGSIEDAKPLTQIRNGRSQWFLYREMLESLTEKKVIGGGYLNPLRPDKSSLFVVGESPAAEKIFQIFGRHKIPCRKLTLQDEEEIRSDLKLRIELSHQGLQSGHMPPEPLRESECLHCEVRDLCGQPYLTERENR